MRRNCISPLLSKLGLLVVVATSAPGLAVAHGTAHLHAAEHTREHGAHQSGVVERITSTTIQETGHGAHEHVQASASVASRASAPQFVVTAVVALAVGSDIPVAAAGPRTEPRDMRNGPPPDRAIQPRAPPLG